MTDYCEKCWAELPGPCDGACSDEPRSEGIVSIVDRLMAQGYDRDEAEVRAQAIVEDDAA